MPRRQIAAVPVAILAILFASPAPGRSIPPCPEPPSASIDRRSIRIRALVSALIPSIYLKLNARAVRQKRRRARLAAPDRMQPTSDRWKTESSRDGDWEVGVVWNPLQIVRRARETARMRIRPLDRSTDRRVPVCPSRPGGGDAHRVSFEKRLERAAAEQKRRSLESRFD